MIPAEGYVIDGKYQLARQIGRGGMAAVWESFDLRLERRVAVKFLQTSTGRSPEVLERFQKEARILATFKSPHVVGILDTGVADGNVPYFVMELLEGEDLDQLLGRQGRLSLAEARTIFTPVLDTLGAAHERGIVHRDIKPSNIFLHRTKEGVTVKVVDFGIAKTTPLPGGSGTATGSLLGTPRYMSPEQVQGEKELDGRSDSFSLGVTMYEALTGRRPFEAQNFAAMLMSILNSLAAPPSSLVESLGPEVDAFFDKALAKDVAGRFASAAAMREAFVALPSAGEAAGEPDTGKSGAAEARTEASPSAQKPNEVEPQMEAPPLPHLTVWELVARERRSRAMAPSREPSPPRNVMGGAPDAEPSTLDEPSTRTGGAPIDDPWTQALGETLPPGLAPHAGPIARFLRALFGGVEVVSAQGVRLVSPSFPEGAAHAFFAVFLAAPPGLAVATQTFMAHTDAIEAHLPALATAALDRLRRIGLVTRREGRERVAVGLLEAWARHNLRPTAGEAERRRRERFRVLSVGVATTLLLVGGYLLWSRPRQAAWAAGSCHYEMDYPGRMAPGAPAMLFVFRTCAEPLTPVAVRLAGLPGTLTQFGEKAEAELTIDDPARAAWRQQKIPLVVEGSRGGFALEVDAAGAPPVTLPIGYDWFAALPDLAKRLVQAASVVPAAIAALIAYGGQIAEVLRKLLGRGPAAQEAGR